MIKLYHFVIDDFINAYWRSETKGGANPTWQSQKKNMDTAKKEIEAFYKRPIDFIEFIK